jgi:hypothetical protein
MLAVAARLVQNVGSCWCGLTDRYDAVGESTGRPRRLVIALHPSITPAGTHHYVNHVTPKETLQ